MPISIITGSIILREVYAVMDFQDWPRVINLVPFGGASVMWNASNEGFIANSLGSYLLRYPFESQLWKGW